uniref:Uncharacterized protein n=1 Tax=Oryza barthii TaxID=65489 RepID=A0A0D3GLL5_9ORYZ
MAADAAARAVSVAFQDASYCLDGGKARHVPHAPSPEKKRASFAAGAAAARAKVCDARWPAAGVNAAPYGFRGGVATRSVAFDEMTPRRASVDVPNPLRAALSSDDTESATSSAGSPDGDADADAKLAARARPSPRSIMASPARFSRDAMGSRSERFADHSTPFMSRTPSILGMRKSIALKKLELQLLRQNCKVMNILKGQIYLPVQMMAYLEEWSLLENKYANSLSGTVEALNATVLRLPVSDGAVADFQSVKNAVGSAVDVMQTMRNSMSYLLPKLARTNVLVSQLSRIASQEQVLMAQCRELLSTLSLMHKQLCGAWVSILGMRKSIALKKLELQLLRQNCKVMNILKGQIYLPVQMMAYLEEWSLLENKYANSLSGTVEALNATVLRLPVSDGAVADFQSVKNAVGSAVDVMQTMRNSMSYLLPKLARTNVLVSQLSRIASQEQVLMAQCRELLSTLSLMHVKHSSLQGQMIQMSHPKRAKDVSSSEYPY